MQLDEYINGKGNKTTFCNRIETELKDWGNMKGATATKFGVYYGRFGKDIVRKYRYVHNLGDTLDIAFNNMKNEIVSLIVAGSVKDYERINRSLISPMLKGKNMSLYYPNENKYLKYFNIFSSSHLDFFINQLCLGLTNRYSEIDKQKIILEYKNSDDIMKAWSIYKFGKFLYTYLGALPMIKKRVLLC
jgi:hypothetical protein